MLLPQERKYVINGTVNRRTNTRRNNVLRYFPTVTAHRSKYPTRRNLSLRDWPLFVRIQRGRRESAYCDKLVGTRGHL